MIALRNKRLHDVTEAIAERELLARGADLLGHGRWSLFEHLAGTSRLLGAWEQPLHLRLAGLFHSVYATDAFSSSLYAADEREKVRRAIGKDAERLADLFCRLDRRSLFDALRDGVPGDGPLHVLDRRAAVPFELDHKDAAHLVVLYLANEAEQACGENGSPAPWLARFSALAHAVAPSLEAVPPVFAHCTAVVTQDAECELLAAYDAVTGDVAADGASWARLRAIAELAPFVAEPFVVLSLASFASGDTGGARAQAETALRLIGETGVTWDKRLRISAWRELASLVLMMLDGSVERRAFDAARLAMLLGRVGGRPDAVHARLAAVSMFLPSDDPSFAPAVRTSAPTTAPPPPRIVPERFARYIALLKDARDPRKVPYPDLSAMPWHDPSAFPIVRELERMAPLIREELRDLDPAAFHAEGEPIERSGSWDIFMLFERGTRRDENCALCPVTTRLIESNRTVRSLAGMCYFSRLAPKTRVAPHRGPTNLRLRCHLGIDIPPDCGLTVAGISRTWSNDRCVVFDDSFEHAVWNDASRERVVFIVDVWHPDLTDEEVALLGGLHAYANAYAHDLNTYWAANERLRRSGGMD